PQPKRTNLMNSKDLIPLARGRPDLVARWASICIDADNKKEAWIAKLRNEGIKAAHPDDGWVDRIKNEVQFVYPQFNDGVCVGDRIALGWPTEWRTVTVVSKTRTGFGRLLWVFDLSTAVHYTP
ncbi:MAG: hypothetical protein ACK53L_12660, partial [Pirellulaceae bacterium]